MNDLQHHSDALAAHAYLLVEYRPEQAKTLQDTLQRLGVHGVTLDRPPADAGAPPAVQPQQSLANAACPLSSEQVAAAMLSIAAQLHSCPDLATACRFVLEELMTLCNAAGGWIALPANGTLEPIAWSGLPGVRWHDVQPWNIFVAEHRQMCLEPAPSSRSPLLTNLLLLPICHHHTLYGVIGLANRPGGFVETLAPWLEALLFPLGLRLAHGDVQADAQLAALPGLDASPSFTTLFPRVFHAAPMALHLLQVENGMLLGANASARQLFSECGILYSNPQPLEALLPADAAASVRTLLVRCASTHEAVSATVSLPLAGPDAARQFTCTLIPLWQPDEQPQVVMGVLQEATSSATEDWHALLDHLTVGVVITAGHDRTFVTANRRAYSLLNGDLSPVLTAQQRDDPCEVASGEQEIQLQVDGRLRVLRMTSTPLMASDGVRSHTVHQLQDITDMRDLERAKEEFVCITSHELQSPLTVIKGYADQLLWARTQGQDHIDDASLLAIDRQVARMRRLVQDLLDISSAAINRLHLEISDIALDDALARMVDEFSQTSGRIVTLTAASGARVRGDLLRLEQVVRNLLDNAAKYSPTDTPIAVTLTADAHEVHVAVRDAGNGIPPEEVALIFDPFYRARAARVSMPTVGFGLGLTLCRHIVERLGGRITIDSTPGEGSVFTVVLPRVQEGAGIVSPAGAVTA
jgi:signal transduction histidine kinase